MGVRKRMKPYKTAGRERLLEFLSSNPDKHFTAEEICIAVHGGEARQSSVYRHLSELCAIDAVRKFRDEETAKTRYQYVGEACDCRNHFHAKCLRCGKIEHLDCGDSVEFAAHLLAEHGFSVDCGHSILYGVCERCRAAGGMA